MYDYKKATYDSANIFRRLSHRARFKIGLDLLSDIDHCAVLDFGCGDGYFLKALAAQNEGKQISFVGLEKYAAVYMNDDFKRDNLLFLYDDTALDNHILNNGKFNYITCFEVLEHCHSNVQTDILQKLGHYLKPDGKIILSVPIEIGVTALLKNIFRFRWSAKKRFAGYTLKNILKSTFYMPISDYRSQNIYFTHMGFDYRQLVKIINNYFTIEQKTYTPLHKMNHILNSQVFFILRKK
jgi:2-polyprenyl-3-methyl-5-hydroxy-6-metoxy-1,4-benzoquinol methylase